MTCSFLKCFLFIAALCCFFSACREKGQDYTTWSVYRGDDGSNAYSQLDQINTGNVKQLEVAWTYNTGDKSQYFSLECNPIIIHDILYGISPKLKTFALDAKTGKQLWVFDPFKDSKSGGTCRGLTYWENKDDQRIFMFAGNKLIALDARTGSQINSFGENGYVDLNKGLRNKGTTHHEDVGNTSPAVIYKDLIITGSSVGEDYGSSPGHIRAYDVRTGEMKWIFHTIPQPGEPGYDTWPKQGNETIGGCNDWSGLSIDIRRGILFAATGGPAFDFHGGERHGKNLFGNSVLALDAATGKLIWHYQISHHDLWDYDLPAPPNLVTIKKDGKTIDAVAQVTKQGFIFLFNRKTGKPLFPIKEKPVAASQMPGEQSWPTQPVPVKPLPLCRQKFDESIITNISPEAHDFVLKEAKKYTWGSIYLPPSTEGIIQMPGMRGGAEWSGACVDMETGIMYVGINDIPNIVQLVERKRHYPDELSKMTMIKAGKILYQKNCAVCHGEDRKGNNTFPPLLNIADRLNPDDVKKQLQKPSGMMPSFNTLPEQDKDAIIAFLFNLKDNGRYQGRDLTNAATPKRYRLKGYIQLKDQNGYPGVKPPWGTLNAVDLNSGELLWKIPLGQFPELAAKGHPHTGTQLFGGGIVTAGGLIFIGASQDEKFRAIDKNTGKILWEYQLPAGGYATPATYEVDGKQYVVIAAGGGVRQGTKAGDYYIAFALP
ncbi:MAG TPA: pyrroloquinoline quinone-dependent dehydrogenase [Chitinophagaceae bacterium]|nr:pyrroloquinoline quinone-dependent dehydrogenase [Chitinophagaceae bacterium]